MGLRVGALMPRRDCTGLSGTLGVSTGVSTDISTSRVELLQLRRIIVHGLFQKILQHLRGTTSSIVTKMVQIVQQSRLLCEKCWLVGWMVNGQAVNCTSQIADL